MKGLIGIGSVVVFLSYKVATVSPRTPLATVARFLITSYTLLLLNSLAFFSRESFIAQVLNRIGVGFPLPEKDYGDVCQIYTPDHPSGDPFLNVTDRLDVFVLAHSLGWFVKALIVRDLGISWLCSILFEFIELAFSHVLPNFRECWWDSVILDVFGCNLIGIHLADYVLDKLRWQKFDFLKTALKRKINYKALFAAALLVTLITLIDVNFFFLQFVLQIPTTHWTAHLRTYSFALISAPASIEMYRWVSKSNGKNQRQKKPDSSRGRFLKECPSAVVGMLGLFAEIAIYTKFKGSMFANAGATPLTTFLLVLTLIYLPIHSFVKI